MPSPKYFDQCAPFPSDVPVADLPAISLKQLEKSDLDEITKLFDGCRNHGFFSLRLNGSERGHELLKDAESMFDLTYKTLCLDKDLLNEYLYKPPDFLGYKPTGILKTDDGKLDAIEVYTIGQDDMLGSEVFHKSHPDPIEEHRSQCRRFVENSHGIVAIILGALNDRLGLPKGTLAKLTSLDRASETALRLLLAYPQQTLSKEIKFGAHTDIGLITLFFNVAGGLQILPAGSENKNENWRYIRPEIGSALVNLGDTFVEWTGGVLRSSLHRVVAPPGQQNVSKRVSVAYLVRPASGETMRRLRGEMIPMPEEGAEDTRAVDEWALERAHQIIKGILRPQTIGGDRMPVQKSVTA